MADIYHQVGVKAGITDVYNAITTLEGLSSWWTDTTGETDQGGQLNFLFNEHSVEMKILKLAPDNKVVWQCIAKDGEWKNTIITFDLVKTDEQIFINFSHTNWLEQSDLCSHCSTKWAVFMLSLKAYLETEKGQPFPVDVQINHLDF